MSDKELLELAAKAAALKVHNACDHHLWILAPSPIEIGREQIIYWAPLTDGADALRLAVKLGMDLSITEISANVTGDAFGICEMVTDPENGDIYSATCRAIVRAAAEIGRQMGDGHTK